MAVTLVRGRARGGKASLDCDVVSTGSVDSTRMDDWDEVIVVNGWSIYPGEQHFISCIV